MFSARRCARMNNRTHGAGNRRRLKNVVIKYWSGYGRNTRGDSMQQIADVLKKESKRRRFFRCQ